MSGFGRALTSIGGAIGGVVAIGPLFAGVAALGLVTLAWWVLAGPSREPVKRLNMVIRALRRPVSGADMVPSTAQDDDCRR